ncbi:ATP-grasp domain-containing protein [Patescibacteria group bacterium]|nr:ATP-grasp domain-containing protein [Patescibacteria group bacterium]
MKKEYLAMSQILQKIAPKIGAKVYLEPKWHIAGQISFKNGRHSYFRYNALDLNPVGAANIAKDKDYAHHFMNKMSYSVIPGSKTFFNDHFSQVLKINKRNQREAYIYAQKLGLPVIIKPNSGSQGAEVSLVYNQKEFKQGMQKIFQHDHIAIVQKYVKGDDYRLVVLDDKVISAYQRFALSVIGDGKNNITKLLKIKQINFNKQGRDTQIKLNDYRIINKLKRQGLTINSIPQKGEKIYLLDNANLSSGGDAIDVTNIIHESYKKLAIKLTRDMGLRFCGVDLIIEGEISKPIDKYWIIEINAAPGLDHYYRSSSQAKKRVENLYLQALKSLERDKK